MKGVSMHPISSLKKAPRKPSIAPSEVDKILAMRETQKALKDRLAFMEEAVKRAEAELIAAIDSGADTSLLGCQVSVESIERRYPAWKEHFISRLGKAETDAVMESTAPTMHRKLVIK